MPSVTSVEFSLRFDSLCRGVGLSQWAGGTVAAAPCVADLKENRSASVLRTTRTSCPQRRPSTELRSTFPSAGAFLCYVLRALTVDDPVAPRQRVARTVEDGRTLKRRKGRTRTGAKVAMRREEKSEIRPSCSGDGSCGSLTSVFPLRCLCELRATASDALPSATDPQRIAGYHNA